MPDRLLERLGTTIRAARNQRDMTQEKLSDLSGVSVRHIGKIEKGEINPSFEVLSSLVTALAISFDSLFYRDSPVEKQSIDELGILYRSCPEQGRRVMLSTARAIAKEFEGTPNRSEKENADNS